MKKTSIAAILAAAALSLTACGASTSADGTDSDALPQADTSSAAAPAAKPAAKPKAAPAPAAPKASTCDVAREAILGENKSTIEKALKALQKDKKADATAREAAQEYFQQTDKDLKGMQLDLIQMACSI